MNPCPDSAGRQDMRSIDLTKGPITRSLLTIAAPIVAGNILQSLVEVADLFFVGRLSPAAIGGVGLSISVIFVLMTLIIGLAGGTTAFVSRYYGEGNFPYAGRVLIQALILGVIFSAAISVVGFIFADEMLALFGAPDEVVTEGAAYLQVLSLGIVTLVEFWIVSTFFQSIGDTKTPLLIILVINVLNILLNPVLIFGIGIAPAMGVSGAAAATVITRAIGLGIGVFLLLHRLNPQMEFTRQAEPDTFLMRRILRVAVPNMVQSGVRSVSYLIMYIIIASYGTLALSAFGIVSRIEMLALMPGFGIATAAAVMVGQNLGAGNPDRSEESAWRALELYGVFMAAITVVFLAFGAGFTEFFDPSGLSNAYAVSYFLIVSPFYVLIAVAIVLSFALNGAGDTRKPMYATILSYFLIQVPLALIVPEYTGTGIVGVWYAMSIGILVQAVALYLMFRSGKWRQIKI